MNSTIEAKRRALLELRLRRQQAEKTGDGPITPIPRQGQLPCSYQQEGLWFLHQLDPASAAYHIALAVRLRGYLDTGALRKALTALVARHESLRTRFHDENGAPEAVIDPAPKAWPMPITELSDDDVDEWVQAQAYLPFDLRTGPLFRSSLARVGPGDHVLLLVTHHVVSDGWSISVLTRDLSGLYDATVSAKPGPELAKLAIQAVDHAGWQRRWLTGAQARQQLSYWRSALDNIQTIEFPTDRIWPAEPTGAGATLRQPLPGGLAVAVRELARSEQVSLLAVLLAAFLVVLNRYTGQQDLAVGSVFSGRTRTEVEPLVGYFAQTVVLRTSLAGDPDWRELVRRCHATVVGAAANQDVPFGLVVEALNPERAQGRNPLFQIGFLLQPAAVTGGDLNLGGIAVSELSTNSDRSRFDLSAVLVEQADGGIELTVEYSTELFDADRVARIAEHYSTVLARLTANPGIPVSQCEVLTEAERAQLLAERAYVLDERLQLAPIGVPGRLYLRAAGESLPDSYSPVPGTRMHATGDLARWRADGELECLGRADRQAKLRGLPVDLAQIEHVLSDDAAVRQAFVAVMQAGTPRARLIGYLVPEPGHDVDLEKTRERLAGQLPAYQVPVAILTLPSLPLSGNGDVDQAKLPDPESQPEVATDTQLLLADAWRGLFGDDSAEIGSHDSFFALGGNSLSIALLVVKIRGLFQVRLDPNELFTYPELGQLAARIDQLVALADEARGDLITPMARGVPLACSYQQEGMWLLCQLDPASPSHHLPVAVRIRGELDVAALSRSLATLVARHESLRTRFDDTAGPAGVPFQVIDAPADAWPLPVAELPPGGEVASWVDAEASRLFDLRTGPVFRSSILRVGFDEHVLMLVLHRLVADDWSVAVLARELSRCYDAERSGLTAPLPELPVQPADHAAWQRQRSPDSGLDRQLDYWIAALGEIEEVAFPADRPRQAELAGSSGAEALLTLPLPGGLAVAVRELARSEQVSLLAVLLAAFLVVLNRYTGQQDLAVGSVFSGRTRTEVEPLVGYFAQTVVLRTSLAGDPDWRELVRRCHATVVGAAANQDVPFGLVVEALNPERAQGRNPLVQIGFSLTSASAARPGFRFGATRTERLGAGWDEPRLDLAVSVVDSADEVFDVAVKYRADLFGGDRVARLAEHFEAALAQLTAGPEVPISQCDITGAEQAWRLGERRPVPALVPLQPEGTSTPLFLVHAIGGSVTPYFALVRQLGADQPSYGLEHPGLRGGAAVRDVSELAASYLAAILQVQAAGPYRLGGWSFGGVVAVEIARQLRRRGAEVAVVLVLDSGLPTAGHSPDQAELLSSFARDVAALADTAPPEMDLTGLSPDQQVDVTLAALQSAGLAPAAIAEEMRHRVEVFLANNRAYLAHQIEPYDGRLVLLRAAEEPDDVTEPWRALAPASFECYTVPGDHYSLLRPPHVTESAEVIRRCLRDLGGAGR